MRRGILGGTFDPPHLAHLFAGETACRELGLDLVTFLPAGSPWQKVGSAVSAPEHRWEMTRLAVEGVAHFEADDREVVRDGWTYTVDTLSEFPDDELILILGSDAAAGIRTWHRPDDVLKMAAVAVVPRPGARRADVEGSLGGDFHWLAGPELAISGTMLRDRVAAGLSIRFLVPEPVAAYVYDHGLYQPESGSASPWAPGGI